MNKRPVMKMPTMAILCGGLGKRMAPLTNNLPKSLIKVAGKPFIFWQLELLKRNGFENVVLCVSHLGDLIRQTVGNGERWGLSIQYNFDNPGEYGTVRAIKAALPLLGREFCTIYGDSYLECPYVKIIVRFRIEQMEALITTFRGQDYGLGVFIPEVFRDTAALNIIDLYRELHKKKRLRELRLRRRFYEIGSMTGLVETKLHLGETNEISTVSDVHE